MNKKFIVTAVQNGKVAEIQSRLEKQAATFIFDPLLMRKIKKKLPRH